MIHYWSVHQHSTKCLLSLPKGKNVLYIELVGNFNDGSGELDNHIREENDKTF